MIAYRRGYHVPYRESRENYCPGCGRSNWWIGSMTAECAFCHTTLELQEVRRAPTGATIFQRGKRQ